MDSIVGVFQFLNSVPAVGHYLSMGMAFVIMAVAVASALAGVLHAVVAGLQALSIQFPKLQMLADSLKKDDDVVMGLKSKVQSLIDRLSFIAVPAKK